MVVAWVSRGYGETTGELAAIWAHTAVFEHSRLTPAPPAIRCDQMLENECHQKPVPPLLGGTQSVGPYVMQ